MTNYNSPMNLAPKASHRGYAMAALLVGMAVMAVLLSVALPTWNQLIRREKEEELVFRGNQYARAIGLYQRKFANAAPPNLDILVEQHMLRKKYEDPMSTEKDGAFQLLYINNSASSGRQGGAGPTGSTTGQPGTVGNALGTTPTGGIMGVSSKNTGTSIRTLNGKTHYNEWQFVAMQQSTQGGVGAPGGRAQGGGPQRGSGPAGAQRGAGPGGGAQSQPPNRGTYVPFSNPGTPQQPPPGQQPPGRGR
jgi:type II secretory pathway pseudopilin PulG